MKTIFKLFYTTIIGTGILIACEEPAHVVPKIIYSESFESAQPFSTAYNMETGDWDYALSYPGGNAYSGEKSARFEIREDQPLIADGKRSEVVVIKGSEGKLAKNAWYSFAVRFPENGYEYDHEHDVISQWSEDGSPVRLLTQKDSIFIEVGSEKGMKQEFFVAAIEKDVWHEVVIHIYHSHEADGILELWYDRERKVDFHGGNMYTSMLPKWKVGIYKPAYSEGTADVYRRIIFFDNIKVGDPNCTYEKMNPKIY